MDAEYLRVERQFRKTYDRIRNENWDEPPSLDVSPDSSSDIGLIAVLCSWSIVGFYLLLAVGVTIVSLVAPLFGTVTGGQ
jgi:hypothetical protein